MVRTFLFLSLIFVVTLASVFAGGQEEADTSSISIMFRGSDLEQAAIGGSVQRFTEATGIEVELMYTAHDVYTEKLAGFFTAGQLPDVIQVDAPTLSNLVWSGYLTAIEPYISEELVAEMTPSNIAQSSYPIDDKLYAIGLRDSSVLLHANRTYLEKVGARIPESVEDAWTIEEFDEVLGKLAELPEVSWPLDIMRAYGTTGEWVTYAFSPTLQSAGGDLIDRNSWKSEGTLNSPESVKAMSYFQDWAEKGWLVPNSAGANQLYNDDRAAAIAWCGQWLYSPASNALGDDYIALPLPNFGTGTVSPNGTWIWGVTETSGNKEAAGQLIEFMLTDNQYREDHKALGAFPALESFADISPDYTDPNKLAIAYEQAVYAVARPPHPAYPTITIEFAKAFDAILSGADATRSLSAAAKAIDENIVDNDGYPPFGE